MTTATTREIVRRKRREYLKSTEAAKKRILDEMEELTGYHRMSLVRTFADWDEQEPCPAVRITHLMGIQSNIHVPCEQCVPASLSSIWQLTAAALPRQIEALLRRLEAAAGRTAQTHGIRSDPRRHLAGFSPPYLEKMESACRCTYIPIISQHRNTRSDDPQ